MSKRKNEEVLREFESVSERSRTKRSERTGGSLMLKTSLQRQFSPFENRNMDTKRFPVSPPPTHTHKILFNPNNPDPPTPRPQT